MQSSWNVNTVTRTTLHKYESRSQQVGDQRDRDSRSLQPVPSGSCPLCPTTTCGHCHWDWAVPQALASSLQKNSTFRISRAQYREGMAKMFNALSGDWPTPFGVGAFQHPPSDRYSPRISGRSSRPNSRRHRLKSASED